MLFSTMAYAQVQIINPGSQEGVFRQILSTIGDSTDHNFVQADNPVTAYTYIEGAEGGTEPILTIWSSEWPGDDSLKSPKVSKENIVELIYQFLLLLNDEEYTNFKEIGEFGEYIEKLDAKPKK